MFLFIMSFNYSLNFFIFYRNFSFSFVIFYWFSYCKFISGNPLSIYVAYLFGIKLIFVANLLLTTLDWFLLLWAEFTLCLDWDLGKFGFISFATVILRFGISAFDAWEALLGGLGGFTAFFWLEFGSLWFDVLFTCNWTEFLLSACTGGGGFNIDFFFCGSVLSITEFFLGGGSSTTS